MCRTEHMRNFVCNPVIQVTYKNVVGEFHYTPFGFPLDCQLMPTAQLWLFCTFGHAATFIVLNAVLVAGQWQHGV